MPRNLEWTGAGDGITFDSAANWKDLATGVAATSTTPDTGDSCLIDREINITAGLAKSALDIATLTIGANATGNLGASGSSLAIGITTRLRYLGRLTICNITAGTNGIAKAIIGGSTQCTLTGGTTTAAIVAPGGNLKVGASAVVTGWTNNGGTFKADAGTAFTTSRAGGGTSTSARNLGTLIASGNCLVRTTDSATITAATVQNGARLNHQSIGTITAVTIGRDGSADAAGAIRPFTVTTRNVEPGAKNAFDGEGAIVTISGGSDDRLLYSGGGLGFDG